MERNRGAGLNALLVFRNFTVKKLGQLTIVLQWFNLDSYFISRKRL